MFIDVLRQHVQVVSQERAISLCRMDRDFWNVISIRGTDERPVRLLGARTVLDTCFDDIESSRLGPERRGASAQDLARAMEFADSVGRDPLLFHCRAGVSRSPAVALAWFYRRLATRSDALDSAVDALLRLSPDAIPNTWVLRLGLECFLPAPEASKVAVAISSHPRLRSDRFPPD